MNQSEHRELKQSTLPSRPSVPLNVDLTETTYTGEKNGDQKHGVGTQVWKDGAKYEGEWVNDKATGKGKFWYANGDVYEGDWHEDKAIG